MGKAVITITDNDNISNVHINVSFDPEVKDGDSTPSQIIALKMIGAISNEMDLAKEDMQKIMDANEKLFKEVKDGSK